MGAITYLSFIVYDFYHVKNEKRSSKKESIKGEKYLNDLNDQQLKTGIICGKTLHP